MHDLLQRMPDADREAEEQRLEAALDRMDEWSREDAPGRRVRDDGYLRDCDIEQGSGQGLGL